MINQNISDLIAYAKTHLGLPAADEIYVCNLLMTKLNLTEIKPCWVNEKKIAALTCPDEIVAPIADYAVKNGLIGEGEEEFFTSDILDMLSPRPSEVIEKLPRCTRNRPRRHSICCTISA